MTRKKFIHGNSKESIKNATWYDNTIASSLINSYPLPDAKFGGNCLINNNISVFRKITNLHLSYTLDAWSSDLNTDFSLGNCLFWAAKLTKHADPDRYSGYGIGFDACSTFLWTNGSWG